MTPETPPLIFYEETFDGNFKVLAPPEVSQKYILKIRNGQIDLYNINYESTDNSRTGYQPEGDQKLLVC